MLYYYYTIKTILKNHILAVEIKILLDLTKVSRSELETITRQQTLLTIWSTNDPRWRHAFSVMIKASQALQQAERQNKFSKLTKEDSDQVTHELERLLNVSVSSSASAPPSPVPQTPPKRKLSDDSDSDASGPSSAKKQRK